MKTFRDTFLQKLNEAIDVSGAPEVDTKVDYDEGGMDSIKNTTTPEAYKDLTQELSSLDDVSGEEVSVDKIISLGRKYSVFFEKVREVVDKVQDGQLAQKFADLFDADLSGLDRKLADVSSQLRAGVKARALKRREEKRKEAAKANGGAA